MHINLNNSLNDNISISHTFYFNFILADNYLRHQHHLDFSVTFLSLPVHGTVQAFWLTLHTETGKGHQNAIEVKKPSKLSLPCPPIHHFTVLVNSIQAVWRKREGSRGATILDILQRKNSAIQISNLQCNLTPSPKLF